MPWYRRSKPGDSDYIAPNYSLVSGWHGPKWARKRTVIRNQETGIDIGRLQYQHDIVIEGFHFVNCKYGILGGKWKGSDIIIRDCIATGTEEQGITLCHGNGTLDYVTMYGNRVEYGRQALTGNNTKGWRVFGGRSDMCHDSDLYFKGENHKAIGPTVGPTAGKDAFKAYESNDGTGWGCGFYAVTALGYSRTETDSGGAGNISCPFTVVQGCHIQVTSRSDAMPSDKTLRALNIQKEGCIATDNILAIPEGSKYDFVLCQDDAEGNAIVENNHEHRY